MNERAKRSRNTLAAMSLLVLVGAGGIAIAAETEGADGPKEKAALAAAKITLPQAIAAAEQHLGGKAIATGIENQDDRVVYYDITIDKGGVLHKVLVDMQSGQVVSSAVEDDDERGENRVERRG